MLPTGGEECRPFRLGPFAVHRWIERRAIRIARPEPAIGLEGFDDRFGFSTAQKGRIGKARIDQPVQRHAIRIEMIRLTSDRVFQASPSQPRSS